MGESDFYSVNYRGILFSVSDITKSPNSLLYSLTTTLTRLRQVHFKRGVRDEDAQIKHHLT